MTAEERAFVSSALGADVARVTNELDVRPALAGWRELLRLLHEQHPEAMESRIGQRITFALIARIYETRDASVRLDAGSETGRERFN